MTNNVNTDDLEKFSSDGKLAGDCEVESMARELLAIREAGDGEVERLEHVLASYEPDLNKESKKLRDIAIARGQQLREAKRREQIMAHHCQKYVEITWEQAEAAYDAAEPVEISREEIDRIVGLVLAMNDEELEGKDLRQQLRDARAEIERLKKILCHVPSRVALEAKESAGYGSHIYPKGEQ